MRPLDYAQSDAISSSEIKHLLTGTPFSFRYNKYEADNSTKSNALVVGSYIHALFLEPDEVQKRYFTMPWCNKTNKEGKIQHELNLENFLEASKENPNIEPICSRLVDDCMEIYNALKDNDIIKESLYFEDRIVEKPIYKARTEVNDVFIKCIPDIVSPSRNLVIDLKTMDDVSPDAFTKQVVRYNYHIQAMLNMMCASEEHGIPVDCLNFEFVCISKKQPYECARYRLSDQWLDIAYEDIIWALNEYKKCVDNNDFPTYPRDTMDIECPRWVRSKLDAIEDETQIKASE